MDTRRNFFVCALDSTQTACTRTRFLASNLQFVSSEWCSIRNLYPSYSNSSATLHQICTVLHQLRDITVSLNLKHWAVQNFRAYIYGHNVTVITDHSAFKVVLDKPDSNGKHARWWLKIFRSGIGNVSIVRTSTRTWERRSWHPLWLQCLHKKQNLMSLCYEWVHRKPA